jgi:hypothetical protein
MYALAVLSLIAVVLLVSANREGLAPTNLIKAPPYNDDEKIRIIQMVPQADQVAYQNSMVGRSLPAGTYMSDVLRNSAAEIVAGFYNEVYRTATSPITLANVTTYAGNLSQSTVPAFRSWATAVLNAYFINQAAVSTPPASSGASTPPPAGTGPSPNPQTGNQASSGSYNQLRAQFDVKKREYDALIASLSVSTNPSAEDITRLRNLNREAFALLEQTIRALSSSQVANMTAVNTELSAALARIDRQYNILVENSDRLEALKRIREYEQVKADGSINVYMTLLLIVALALLVIMMFSQRMNPTIASAPASPAITPNLT